MPLLVNEFWTSRQRAAHSLHEISYRACFKPQLPRFFIKRLTAPGETVYDPFSGRGTTALEAALLGRRPVACDVNLIHTSHGNFADSWPTYAQRFMDKHHKRIECVELPEQFSWCRFRVPNRDLARRAMNPAFWYAE